jgi:lysophosphatidate acyltransferase
MVTLNPATFLAKREILRYFGPLGWTCWLAGFVFVDRSGGASIRDAVNQTMRELKKSRIKLIMFPEGTRKLTGNIGVFKKGAFHAAIYAQVPIVPVVFSPQGHIFNPNEKIFNSGTVIIEALPEIQTSGLTCDAVDALIDEVRNAMTKKFEELETEIDMKNQFA